MTIRTGSEPATIGIDIGGTSVRAGVVTDSGTVLYRLRASTPKSVSDTEDVICGLVGKLAALHPVQAVGLAVAGFVTSDRTEVMFAPHLAWRGDPVPERLSARLGLPVVIEHDVNSAAWAEYTLGVAQNSPVALLVALGTGIGAGLVLDGQLYRGAHGIAPELGHMVMVPSGRQCPCGKRGCWERYCSGTALADTARELVESSGGVGELLELCDGNAASITGAMVGTAAADGDEIALAALNELGRWLGEGLAIVADILDPECVVIGGGVAGASRWFLPVAVSRMRDMMTGGSYRPEPRLLLPHFGSRAAIIGAALIAAGSVALA